MGKFKIDGHKLGYHVDRVSEWLNGATIYPVYMEISPSGLCNHRCSFCAMDFMGYRKRFLDAALLKERLSELGRLGLKSIMFGGEGEPLLHKDIVVLAQWARKNGIDVAFTTNGVFLDPGKAEPLVGVTEWVKVSINAGTPETYAMVHRTRAADFDKVINNLARAVELKRRHGFSCVLGMQILLLPENRDEVVKLATIGKDIGVDYLVVKPYSQHPASNTRQYKDVKYDGVETICAEAAKLTDERFRVIVRADTIRNWNERLKTYNRCLALPFWSYIDSGGGVWGCSAYLGDERFLYGNIHDASFEEIWQGEKRRASLQWVENDLDARNCRINCRMDKINQYLWELKQPPQHVNFI